MFSPQSSQLGNVFMFGISRLIKNILPLILREVRILGLNAESSNIKERESILRVFESPSLKKKLLNRTRVINLQEVSKLMNSKKYDKKSMRYIVKI